MAVNFIDVYKQKSEINNLTFEPIESYERLKIARGYYAAFSHGRSLFNTLEPINGNKLNLHNYQVDSNGKKRSLGPHQKIYMSLQFSKIRTLVDAGVYLQKYHILRKKADYDLHLNITDDDICEAETYYNEFKVLIDHYVANGTQPLIKAKKTIKASTNSPKRSNISGLKVLK